jgi:hypothetical protein
MHFLHQKIVFSGFILSCNGIEVDEAKVKPIKHFFPIPKTIGQYVVVNDLKK